jgi:hypothetical protein
VPNNETTVLLVKIALHIAKHDTYPEVVPFDASFSTRTTLLHKRYQTLLLSTGCLLVSFSVASGQATVRFDSDAIGKPIPRDFVGLSFETSATLPSASGKYPYFSAGNKPLIRLFRTLGIGSLRIGGNTSDRPSVPVPTETDINQVFDFARSADARVIYTLRLRGSSAEKVQATARYIMERFPAQVDCLVVGNEPNVYEGNYPHYADDLRAFYPAVLSTAPNARFCGPSTTPGAGVWVKGFIHDFGAFPQTLEVTQHAYPGGNSRKVTDPAAGRALMLSPAFIADYQHLYDAFVPDAQAAHVRYRIEETNSFFNGGAKDVSNTFASSLWALSYIYWWLQHEAAGINFHTGDQVAAGEIQTPCWYAMFWNKPNGAGLDVHPIAYALAAFHLAGSGTLLPVGLEGAPEGVDAYRTVNSNNETFLTLINRNFGTSAAPITITLPDLQHRGRVQQMTLLSPGNNESATTGTTLGGSSIRNDGSWAGKWSAPSSLQKQATPSLVLAPASAIVIRWSK